MAFGFAELKDIERVVRAVLVTERLTQNDRTRTSSGGATAPACSYIAQSSTGGVPGSTGDGQASSATVKFYSISTGSTLSELSTGETVYNFSRSKIPASKYFLAVREYGSQNYVVPPAVGFVRIKGATTAAVSGSAFTINTIAVMQGADPRDDPTSSSETVTVQNRLGEHADALAYCEAVYDESTDEWVSNHLDSTCPPAP